MLIQQDPPLHLTYCLNVHRGGTWNENLAAIRDKALAVRDRVSPGKPFGLGLRLSAQAAIDLFLPEPRERAKAFFREHNVYPFTINGFPHGEFHRGRIKEQVYAPDWQSADRRDYTKRLADILADFLPDGAEGSVSTVPCSFKEWIRHDWEVEIMVRCLCDTVGHLADLRERTGREIHVGLEPEPSCYLETTDETIAFFKNWLLTFGRDYLVWEKKWSPQQAEEAIRRHLGVCFDTCHVAIQFEDLAQSLHRYESEGIRISKVQISNAIQAAPTPETCKALEAFEDGTYLHQVKGRDAKTGRIRGWDDIWFAIRTPGELLDLDEFRCHFHVPLFFEGNGPLRSTGPSLTPEFWRVLRRGTCKHIEIETYTFDVLPPEIRPPDIVESIAREYEWVLGKWTAGGGNEG